ncbi:phosphoribosylformylglycinamidine synthase II, partial [Mycobacterium tuberculosis]|nr:phosphoribosylformylglycinamidine synthase II [Mycobacterium tuberculosis]
GEGRVVACHDLSDGGLAVALAEMCMAGNRGLRIDLPNTAVPIHAFLFGEDQARYLVVCRPEDGFKVLVDAQMAGIPATTIGSVYG